MPITKEQLQNEIQAEVKGVIVDSMQIVKRYIDEHSIDNTAKREELKNEIADAIAQKYDFENEKEKLEKASKVADTLLGLFDANEDAEISPSIYAQLETTNQINEQLVDLAKEVGSLRSYVDAQLQNFFTKDDIKEIMTINKDEIVNAVKGIFYPAINENNSNGDGATL